MNPSEEQPYLDVVAFRAAAEGVIYTMLGHTVTAVEIREDDAGALGFECFCETMSDLTAWHGAMAEFAATQTVNGCEPRFGDDCSKECSRCIANSALRFPGEGRAFLQDRCEDARAMLKRGTSALNVVAAKLVTNRRISGEQIRALLQAVGV